MVNVPGFRVTVIQGDGESPPPSPPPPDVGMETVMVITARAAPGVDPQAPYQ